MNSKTRNLGSIGQMLNRARNTPESAQKEYVFIDVEKIEPRPDQPRKTFHEVTLRELAASIKEYGVLEPLIVLPENDGKHHLVAGERRWRASQLAGKKEVPCIIRDIAPDDLLVIAIIENIQREDLPALEEADSINRLVEFYGSQNIVAEKLGRKKDYVSKMVTAASLPDRARQAFASGAIRDVESLNHVSRVYKIDSGFGDQLVSFALENDGVTRAYTASMLKRAKEKMPPISPADWSEAENAEGDQRQPQETPQTRTQRTAEASTSALRRSTRVSVCVAVPSLNIDCAELVFEPQDDDPDAIWAISGGDMIRVDGHDVRIVKAVKA